MTTSTQYRTIRATMMQHGVTLNRIAEIEGVTPGYVTFVVTGRRQGYRIRAAIAKECGVSIETFWPDTPIEYRRAA